MLGLYLTFRAQGGSLHQILDGKPNAAYLMDTSGKTAFRSLFAGDEGGLRAALESASRGRTPAKTQSRAIMVPVAKAILKQREVIVTAEDDHRDDYRMIGSPLKLEKSPVTVTQAPRYSEHTDEILKSMLGVSEDQLVELRSDGVII